MLADHFKKIIQKIKPVNERNKELAFARPPAPSLLKSFETVLTTLVPLFTSLQPSSEAAWPDIRLGSMDLLLGMVPFWMDDPILQGGPVARSSVRASVKSVKSVKAPHGVPVPQGRRPEDPERRHAVPEHGVRHGHLAGSELLRPPVAVLLLGR